MLARNFLLASLFSFQGTDSNLFQGQIEMLTRLSKHFNPNLKRSGGDKRNRTAGLLLARQALSQLSYTPMSRKIQVVGPSGLEPPTSRLSVVRSSQLSYGPVVVDAKSAPFVTPSRPSLTALPCVSSPKQTRFAGLCSGTRECTL